MKIKITILFVLTFFLGCITSKDVKNLSLDQRILFPIRENDRWGFANSEGVTVIAPAYEEVTFFSEGLAVVRENGKYGYLKKDGSWHIKPTYTAATSFDYHTARVSTGDNLFSINRKGRKLRNIYYHSKMGGGCLVRYPADPNKIFTKINGKYELEYTYYVKGDSATSFAVMDTSALNIEEVIPYGKNHILVKKNEKYGLFDIWNYRRIIIDSAIHTDHRGAAHSRLSSLIEFKYDEVIFERSGENQVIYAKVRVDDKYGVMSSAGKIIVPIDFDSLEIDAARRMVFVEYEPDKFGYQQMFGKGTEFFKRTEK